MSSKKNKYEYVTGCVCDSLTINGTEITQPKELKSHICKILDTINDLGTLQSILINLIEFTGDCKIDGPCESCGDYIYTYNLEVDE